MSEAAAIHLSCIEVVKRATGQLAHFVQLALHQQLEPVRVARAAYALLSCGCSRNVPFLGHTVSSYLTAAQRSDGGWVDVEETAWCLGYLSAFGDRYIIEVANGRNWLASVRLPCGAWGKCERDQPRITLTALISTLAPETVDASGLEWLTKQWKADLANPVQFTYKGAFFLIALMHELAPHDDELLDQTLAHLCAEQEVDGGFAPWKGHPAGGDPWTAGIVLWGLSKFAKRVPAGILERTAAWLQSRQLPDGLWAYHYLDDGTSMALIGLSSVLPFLSKE